MDIVVEGDALWALRWNTMWNRSALGNKIRPSDALCCIPPQWGLSN